MKLGLGLSKHNKVSGYTPSAEAATWEAAIIANGGTIDAAVLQVIDENFIIPNVAGGNWPRFKRANLWITNTNEIASRTTIAGGSYFASFVASPVFNNEGVKSDGVAAYVDLEFNPFTEGVSQNDVSVGYIVKTPPFAATVRAFGCTDAVSTLRLEVYELAGQSFVFVNCSNFTANTNDVSTGNVLLAGKRSNGTDETAVINASKVTVADASTGVPNHNAFELISNDNGTPFPANFDTQPHLFSWHGTSAVDTALLKSTIDALEIALAAL